MPCKQSYICKNVSHAHAKQRKMSNQNHAIYCREASDTWEITQGMMSELR